MSRILQDKKNGKLMERALENKKDDKYKSGVYSKFAGKVNKVSHRHAGKFVRSAAKGLLEELNPIEGIRNINLLRKGITPKESKNKKRSNSERFAL